MKLIEIYQLARSLSYEDFENIYIERITGKPVIVPDYLKKPISANVSPNDYSKVKSKGKGTASYETS